MTFNALNFICIKHHCFTNNSVCHKSTHSCDIICVEMSFYYSWFILVRVCFHCFREKISLMYKPLNFSPMSLKLVRIFSSYFLSLKPYRVIGLTMRIVKKCFVYDVQILLLALFLNFQQKNKLRTENYHALFLCVM